VVTITRLDTLDVLLAGGAPKFTVVEIAAEAHVGVAALKSWIGRGRLKLDPKNDEASLGGRGVSNRLHWRTVAALLLAVKLNDYGFGLINGEATDTAHRIAEALTISDLCTTEPGRLVIVKRVRIVGRVPRRGIEVGHVARRDIARVVTAPVIVDRFTGVGTLVIDPLGIGEVIWRMIKAREPANAV
jgi:hypothetical protein